MKVVTIPVFDVGNYNDFGTGFSVIINIADTIVGDKAINVMSPNGESVKIVECPTNGGGKCTTGKGHLANIKDSNAGGQLQTTCSGGTTSGFYTPLSPFEPFVITLFITTEKN